MAGDWIKMRVCLWTHPKVVTVASRLSVTKTHAIGALYCAWCIADQHANKNGHISMTADALDSLCEMPGLTAAMASVGWMTLGETSLQFVSYQEHNGATAKQRASANKRQKLSRSRHGRVTVRRDKSVTREEKRREEKKEEKDPPTPQSTAVVLVFKPPTIDEVRAYCIERRNRVDPEAWFNHYTSNGWMVGRTKMKDWRAAVRTWEKNNFSAKPKGPHSSTDYARDTLIDAVTA